MARRERYIFAEEPRHGRGVLIGFLLVLLLLVAGLFTWNFALNHSVVYQKQYVAVSNLPSALENWTILHMSDLNGASIGDGQSAVRKVIGSKSFSCVVLSGNMIGPAGDEQPLLDLVALLPKGTPVLFLPGDNDPSVYDATAHGSLSAYADWALRLQEAGVTILDEPVSFQRDRSTIWFIPEYLYSLNLDSSETAYRNQLDTLNVQTSLTPDQAAQKRHAEFQIERMERIRTTIATIRESDIQIAVSHMPLTREDVRIAKTATGSHKIFNLSRASLVLAGGYCGGQWRLPGGGAIWAPGLGFFPEDIQIRGLGYIGGLWQHISPGLGVSSAYPLLPFRMFNSPEVTMLVLSANVH